MLPTRFDMTIFKQHTGFGAPALHRLLSFPLLLMLLSAAQILAAQVPASSQDAPSHDSARSNDRAHSNDSAHWPTDDWPHTDFSKTIISPSGVMAGGPARDGIPSIDHPRFFPADAEFLSPKGAFALEALEPVIRVEINGDARAYPLRILLWHEIVNDVVGGVPVVVTYCPLCNAALVFERQVNGQILDFGTSGLLRHSDLVMYDRTSQSWWQQFTGEAIVGEMVGQELTPVASRLEAFQLFKATFPTGKVLVPNDLTARTYERTPYARYDAETGRPFLFSGVLPPDIPAMARVISVEDENGDVLAWSLALLRRQKEIRHGSMVLRWVEGQRSVLDRELVVLGRDIGNVLVQRRQNGTLVDLAHHETFAFAFHAFHPDRPIYQQLPETR